MAVCVLLKDLAGNRRMLGLEEGEKRRGFFLREELGFVEAKGEWMRRERAPSMTFLQDRKSVV